MKCPKCNLENNKDAKFCIKCGYKLSEKQKAEQKQKINFMVWVGLVALVGIAAGAYYFSTAAKKPKMIFVKGGTFQMGSNNGDSDEKPIHQVNISDFYIGKYEITQKEWEDVMGFNPSKFKGSNRPVETISWNDVQEFVKKLNIKTGKKYRLPTEAEWEYAARGGNKSKGYKYSGSNTVGHVGWYWDNSGKETHNVGAKKPNELGIYDMSGNVWAGGQDKKADDAEPNPRLKNPKYDNSGSHRERRGGSWRNNPASLRCAFRYRFTPGDTYSRVGFRLIREN